MTRPSRSAPLLSFTVQLPQPFRSYWPVFVQVVTVTAFCSSPGSDHYRMRRCSRPSRHFSPHTQPPITKILQRGRLNLLSLFVIRSLVQPFMYGHSSHPQAEPKTISMNYVSFTINPARDQLHQHFFVRSLDSNQLSNRLATAPASAFIRVLP